MSQADAELEALRTSATRVRDLVLGGTNGPSSRATSMSAIAEQLEGRINAATANGARWGLVLCWLQLYRTSQSWMPSRRCLGLDAAQT
jgi:hypothetical protein